MHVQNLHQEKNHRYAKFKTENIGTFKDRNFNISGRSEFFGPF
jgi:hypothetical protein